MAKIVILQGPGAGAEYELPEETILGRAETADVPIEDGLASREHARIERRGDRYAIIDLGSSNGTSVNGSKVTEHALRPGDRVVIGSVRMRFEDPDFEEPEPVTVEAPETVDTPVPEPSPAAVPQVYEQQYWLLLGCVAISVGCLTVWEREHVCGKDVYGFQMITGAFILLFAVFGSIEGVLGILQGRLRVVGAFLAGLLGLIYGFMAFRRILSHDGFRPYGEVTDDGAATLGAAFASWAGQVGPGVWLTVFGAVVIAVVIGRAMLAPSSVKRR
jgi:hypothetical protein